MKKTLRSSAAVVASLLSLVLVACGGDLKPETRSGDTGGSDSSTSSEGGSGGGVTTTGSGETQPMTVTVEGTPITLTGGWAAHPSGGWLSIEAFDGATKNDVNFFVMKPDAPGTWSCASGVGIMYYLDPSGKTFTTAYGGGECSITLTKIATAPGEMWVGSFSGTLPNEDGSGETRVLTDGEFHLVEPEPAPAP